MLAPAAQAQATAESALNQIINAIPAARDREQIGKFYAADAHRLFWSDGAKPAAAAALLQELRQAAERGLDPGTIPQIASPGS